MKLTAAQLEAIQRTGQDVCVVAGPGSGKTTVLIERFKWLVEKQGVDPTRILAITFTEKAAMLIKQRLLDRFANSPDQRDAIERAWVSTIHGFCARLLRENSIEAGLAPDFTVLEQAAADRLARDSAEEALEEMFRERPAEMRRVFEALDLSTDDGRNPDLARSLLVVYESMRVEGLRELPAVAAGDADAWPRARELAGIALADRSPLGAHVGQLREFAACLLALPDDVGISHFAALRAVDTFHLNRIGKGTRALEAARELKEKIVPLLKQQWIARWYAAESDLLREAVARLDAIYREKKRRDAALDFADLEAEAIRLLEENAELRERTASRFDQVLMDELQDTNRLQWRLVNLIRRGFFGVGDLNQSIYGFRHAEAEVFAEYRASLIAAGATIDDLRENHRSVPEVLEAVSSVLDGQPGIETRKLIASRDSLSNTGCGPGVELLIARGGEVDDADDVEASLVAARIRELSGGAVPLKDVAILVRTLGAAKPFERALDRFGIPFMVSGGRTFLEAREIRDLLALMAALVNPLDEVALAGVLRSPLVGMSDQEMFRIGREEWRAEFDRHFGKLRRIAGFTAPDLLLAAALDECGYVAGLPDRARANIEKLLAHIRREHSKHPRPLAELLEDLEALRATQSEAEAPPPEAGNVVRVMTIHAAKGLEFPVVFVSALHRQTDSTRPVIVFSRETGVGAKWRNPATGEGQSDHAHRVAVEGLRAKEAEEENRLLYVAMTRAGNRLILSYTEKKRGSAWPKLVSARIAPAKIAAQVIDWADSPARVINVAGASDRLLDPPANVTRRDGAAAVTSISAFHACPRKYLLSSISSAARPAGNFADGNFADDDSTDGGGAKDHAGLGFGAAVHRVLAGEDTGSTAAEELAAGFRSSELGRRAARADRVEREFDFLFYIEDVVLRGQIDLWFEESGELIVVDYKTDREESSEGYQLQLQIYSLALERYAGRAADRAILYYLRSGAAIEINIDEHAARAAIRRFLDAQDSLEYPMNPGLQCRRCAFFGNLCAGTGAAAAG
jgi:ATP-dependent exoDNAse (exonuclease V) beta subunit